MSDDLPFCCEVFKVHVMKPSIRRMITSPGLASCLIAVLTLVLTPSSSAKKIQYEQSIRKAENRSRVFPSFSGMNVDLRVRE